MLALVAQERSFVDSSSGETFTHRIAGTDSGFNHLIRPILYQAYHHIVNVGGGSSGEATESTAKYDITGNICESGDLFAKGRQLRWLHEGDVLDIENAGAYCRSMASEYNMRAIPNEVVIDEQCLGVPGSEAITHTPVSQSDLMRTVVVDRLTYKQQTPDELVHRFLSGYGDR